MFKRILFPAILMVSALGFGLAPVASAGWLHSPIERQHVERNRYYGYEYNNRPFLYNNRPDYYNRGPAYSSGYGQTYSSGQQGHGYDSRDGGRNYNNRGRGYEGRSDERGYRH